MKRNIVIVGASGALGQAFTVALKHQEPATRLHLISSKTESTLPDNSIWYQISYGDEETVAEAAEKIKETGPIDMVLVASGILHGDDFMPEKGLKDISQENLQKLFLANTILPTLIAKYFIPQLHKDERAIFAALSARVGSISDNHLGGWYAYRASKAALNMIIKTASIEATRRHKKSIVVGLHPGTVDSALSKPFSARVAENKLFTAEYSVAKLLSVLDGLTSEDTGKCFAWDGQEILP